MGKKLGASFLKTKILLRESGVQREITISSEDKPDIPDTLKSRWQALIDLSAEVFDMPAVLFMRIHKNDVEVYLKSSNKENPYEVHQKEPLGSGLYCETAIGEDEPFKIPNALKDDRWKDNPDVNLGMVAYFGIPIKWNDSEVFGTLCFLDNEENPFALTHKKALETYQAIIEGDLHTLEVTTHLDKLARYDSLTEIPNRLSLYERLEEATNLYHRNHDPFCFVILDIKDFKAINDKYGHDEGDEVLRAMGRCLRKRLRTSDVYGRFDGDEFAMLLRGTTRDKAENVVSDLKIACAEEEPLKTYEVDFKYGIAEMNKAIKKPEMLYRIADQAMMRAHAMSTKEHF